MAHSQTAHRLAKSLVRAGLRLIVTMTELPGVPERRRDPEPHAPRGRIHRRVGALRTDRSAHRTSRPRQTHPVGTPAFRPSACATAQAFDHKTSVPAEKTSGRREGKRTTGRQAEGEKASAPGAPGTRTPNLTTPTGPTPSVSQPSSHPPALQRKPLTTRQAFPQEGPADDKNASGRREGKRTKSARSATHPSASTVGPAGPGEGTHL